MTFPVIDEGNHINTFITPHGKVSLLANDAIIVGEYRKGNYWDIEGLQMLKQYIDPNRNILEIGGHCGTDTIVYASYLNESSKLFVYEPQKRLYDVLVKNIQQNNLSDKVMHNNKAVFSYSGTGTMDAIDLDTHSQVSNRYTTEKQYGCNFGGVGIGPGGEDVTFTTVDEMGHTNIGFIHCDAQGAEQYIFSKAQETIKRDRPVIYYENPQSDGGKFIERVEKAQPGRPESKFDVEQFCVNELGYRRMEESTSNNILLVPT